MTLRYARDEVQPGAVEGHREIALAGQVVRVRVLPAGPVREHRVDRRRRRDVAPRVPLAAIAHELVHLGPLATDPQGEGEVEVGDRGPEADAGPSAGHDRLPAGLDGLDGIAPDRGSAAVGQRPRQLERDLVLARDAGRTVDEGVGDGVDPRVLVAQAQGQGDVRDGHGVPQLLRESSLVVEDAHHLVRVVLTDEPGEQRLGEVERCPGGVGIVLVLEPQRPGDLQGLLVAVQPAEGRGTLRGCRGRGDLVSLGQEGPRRLCRHTDGLLVEGGLDQRVSEHGAQPRQRGLLRLLAHRRAEVVDRLVEQPERACSARRHEEEGDRRPAELGDVDVSGEGGDGVEVVLRQDRRLVAGEVLGGPVRGDDGEVDAFALAHRQGGVRDLVHDGLAEGIPPELGAEPTRLAFQDLQVHELPQHGGDVHDVGTQVGDPVTAQGRTEDRRDADDVVLVGGERVQPSGDQGLERGRGRDRLEVEPVGRRRGRRRPPRGMTRSRSISERTVSTAIQRDALGPRDEVGARAVRQAGRPGRRAGWPWWGRRAPTRG